MTRRHAPEELELDPGPLYRSLAVSAPQVSRESSATMRADIPRTLHRAAGAAAEPIHGAATSTVEAARARGHADAKRAASKAKKLDPWWIEASMLLVHQHALEHATFLAEHVPIVVPEGADPRAVGAVFRRARACGWIKADGFAATESSNGSAKVLWRSLVLAGVSA